MQLIKIESIKYGWFEMRFGNHYIDCSDYLGNDTPKRLLKTAYDLLRSARPLKESCGEQVWSKMFDASLFVDELVTEFVLYRDGTGLSIYEKNWMTFPEKELAALKAYAVELSKNMGKYDELFCTSYL